jgi:K+-sensing histidine kinase KdpD
VALLASINEKLAKAEMMADIQEANERLDRLVGKVFDMTRLESGHIAPKLTQSNCSSRSGELDIGWSRTSSCPATRDKDCRFIRV